MAAVFLLAVGMSAVIPSWPDDGSPVANPTSGRRIVTHRSILQRIHSL
ncbi:hypothetical protein FB566_2638 [Stackebrandtia endophytica]|uniref:Uncharacterized protein n=2 Tax=Stackebrandtia endophytica TaxID=1496996 RepID=A0A543AX02_9ACTN|nr:hypothetical protein FB566_2638 [Stackebrandtia endophytica]